MAEFASAIIDLSAIVLRSSKIILDFVQKIRGQNARWTELALKLETLSIRLECLTRAVNVPGTLDNPTLSKIIKLFDSDVNKCRQEMEQVTKYLASLTNTLQGSMWGRFLHECRHEFSGRSALRRSFKEIDDRVREITDMTIINMLLTHDLGQPRNPDDPWQYPQAPLDRSLSLTPSASETLNESGSSLRSETTRDTHPRSEAPAPHQGELVEQELSTQLIEAIKINEVSLVRQMIGDGTQILLKDEQGWCALHHAVWAGHEGVLQELLISKELHVNPKGIDTRDHDGYSALHRAARVGQVRLGIMLIKARADINLTNKFGRSVLYFALEANKEHLVKALLKREVVEDPNSVTKYKVRLQEMKDNINCHRRKEEKTGRNTQEKNFKVSVRG